jgi:hypothetical protein
MIKINIRNRELLWPLTDESLELFSTGSLSCAGKISN